MSGVRVPSTAQMNSKTALRNHWKKHLTHFDWYIRLEDFLEAIVFPLDPTPEEKELRREFYELVDNMLQKKMIPLSEKKEDSPNFDEERKTIDTIVIHHTKENFNISLNRLSALGFIRQYAKIYLGDNLGERSNLRGQPIWSGHFDNNGNMVFYAYHWIIRPNGETERLLKDQEIGHHAGSESIDERSVAIVLAGDYSNSTPPEKQINTVREIIKQSYPKVEKVVGHKDIRPDRACPGDKWDEWKKSLI